MPPISVSPTNVSSLQGIYLQADASVAPQDQERILREFLPASSRPEARNAHLIVSGRLLSVDATWMVVESNGNPVRVKLSPEADGELLRQGTLSDLHPGSTVTMALPTGGVRAVLVNE